MTIFKVWLNNKVDRRQKLVSTYEKHCPVLHMVN